MAMITVNSVIITNLRHTLFYLLHGETFYINFYYSIFQFKEKRITENFS